MSKLSDFQRQHHVGVKGETIFYRPIDDLMFGIEDQLKADGMRSTLNRMESYGDERSKVLLAALAAEAVIDKVLEALMPRYKALFDEDRDMTFSMKTKVLKGLAIVPKHFTEAADIVRNVRNKFAHNLTVEKLDDLPTKVKEPMKQYYARRKIDPQDKREDLAHVFDVIAHVATASLHAYLPLVRDLNETIRQPKFEEKLIKQAEKRQREQIRMVMAHVQKPAPERSDPF